MKLLLRSLVLLVVSVCRIGENIQKCSIFSSYYPMWVWSISNHTCPCLYQGGEDAHNPLFIVVTRMMRVWKKYGWIISAVRFRTAPPIIFIPFCTEQYPGFMLSEGKKTRGKGNQNVLLILITEKVRLQRCWALKDAQSKLSTSVLVHDKIKSSIHWVC